MDFLKEFLINLLTQTKFRFIVIVISFILFTLISYPFVSKLHYKKHMSIRKNDFNENVKLNNNREDKIYHSIAISMLLILVLFVFSTCALNMLYSEEKTSIKSEQIYEQGKDYAFHINDNNVFFLNDEVIVRKIEDHSTFDRQLKNMFVEVLSFDKDFMNDYEQNGLSEEIEYKTEISRLSDNYDRSSTNIVDKRKSSKVVNSNQLIIREIEYTRTLFDKEIETKSELQIEQIIE